MVTTHFVPLLPWIVGFVLLALTLKILLWGALGCVWFRFLESEAPPENGEGCRP